MKSSRTVLASLAFCFTILGAGSLFASSPHKWYGGFDVGQTDHEFSPRYTVPGAPDSTFINESDGTQFGLFVGHDWALYDRFSLGVQGRVEFNDAEWTLSIPEPASFKYEIPTLYSIGLLSRFELSPRIVLFAELAAVQAEVNEKKFGSPDSNYDVSETADGVRYGGGLAFPLDDIIDARTSLVIAYRVVDLSSFSYVSRDSAGMQVERITDSPETASWSIGLLRRF